MVWSTAEFADRVEQCLNATGQYVFVSSYRVYADSPVIAEDSPRLLDVVDDSDYLKTDEYALAKARCENMLFESGKKNWTIVRPAVTYDGTGRFQLAVHESEVWLRRALNDIPVPLPDVICGKQGTMTWGGDVARMIALLIGNPQALSVHRVNERTSDLARNIRNLQVCCADPQGRRLRYGEIRTSARCRVSDPLRPHVRPYHRQ